jgi:hypothetical protein
MTKEYWLREEKKKIYRTQRAFVKDARYSFFDRVNFRLLVNLTTVKEDQDPDRKWHCILSKRRKRRKLQIVSR